MSRVSLVQFLQSARLVSPRLAFNDTEASQPLVIYNSNNETMLNGSHPAVEQVDKNQFAETVVDLLLDLLEKANLSRTVSVIHNETELTELVEQDDTAKRTTTQLPDP